ncbi:MAG: hypothetical protein ACPLY7_00635 [Microgenomates group bacterium]
MKRIGEKALSFFILILLFSLLINFFRQIVIYRRISLRLTEERKRLETLEKKNRELKIKLAEIKGRSQNDVVFSFSNLEKAGAKETSLQNWKKWQKLFFY